MYIKTHYNRYKKNGTRYKQNVYYSPNMGRMDDKNISRFYNGLLYISFGAITRTL